MPNFLSRPKSKASRPITAYKLGSKKKMAARMQKISSRLGLKMKAAKM